MLNAGLAFQIVDDVLDFTDDESLLGKPSRTDLRQKTPSIVNVLWLDSGDPRALNFFKQGSDIETDSIQEVLEHLKHSPIIDQAKQLAAKHAEMATNALLSLPDPLIDTKTRSQLLAVIEYTVKRCL